MLKSTFVLVTLVATTAAAASLQATAPTIWCQRRCNQPASSRLGTSSGAQDCTARLQQQRDARFIAAENKIVMRQRDDDEDYG